MIYGSNVIIKCWHTMQASPEVIKSVAQILGLDPSFSDALLPAVAQDVAYAVEDATGPEDTCVLNGDALIAVLVSKQAVEKECRSTGLHTCAKLPSCLEPISGHHLS